MLKIGHRLKALRKERKLLQVDMAKTLGISQSTYCAYEADREPPLSVIVKLAEIFGTTTDYLLTGVEAEQKSIHQEIGLSGHCLDILRNIKQDETRTSNVIEAFIAFYSEHYQAIDTAFREYQSISAGIAALKLKAMGIIDDLPDGVADSPRVNELALTGALSNLTSLLSAFVSHSAGVELSQLESHIAATADLLSAKIDEFENKEA